MCVNSFFTRTEIVLVTTYIAAAAVILILCFSLLPVGIWVCNSLIVDDDFARCNKPRKVQVLLDGIFTP